MPRTGLTHERVVEAAAALIEQGGTDGFSMRALADSLHIKTASLYNHVESMDALLAAVCAYGLELQCRSEMAAIAGKTGPEAIYALADAYRRFAGEHRQLYRLIIATAATCGDRLDSAARCIVQPFMAVLAHTSLSDSEKHHWQRVLRAILHGFVSQEDAGFFTHLPADADDSFRTAVRCYLDGLAQAEGRRVQ